MRVYLLKSVLLVFVFLVSNSWAFDVERGRELNGYQPSYFVFAHNGEDDHIEFNISIKHPLDNDVEWLENLMGGDSNKVYFAYTGQYDFFVFSDASSGRDSAPVVSRIQNPGIFIKHENNNVENKYGFQSIAVGWFHESNGQQIDDNATFVTTTNASDFVSRGWDYLGIDVKLQKNNFWLFKGHVNLYTRLRLICGCQGFGLIGEKEDDIRVLGGTETADIRDFDGLRIIFDNYPSKNLRYGLELRTGLSSDAALENWSYRLGLSYRLKGFAPITFFYFNGYGENLSTYHLRDEYVGLGIRIW